MSAGTSPDRPPRARLPRPAILRGRSAFSDLFNRGSGLRFGRLVLKYQIIEAPPVAPPVAGFVVKRGYGGAVQRNRIKRLLREAWRLERSGFASALPPAVGLRVVLLWTGPPGERPGLDAVRHDLAGALRSLARRLRTRGHESPG